LLWEGGVEFSEGFRPLNPAIVASCGFGYAPLGQRSLDFHATGSMPLYSAAEKHLKKEEGKLCPPSTREWILSGDMEHSTSRKLLTDDNLSPLALFISAGSKASRFPVDRHGHRCRSRPGSLGYPQG
jgi:hypothetical protein